MWAEGLFLFHYINVSVLLEVPGGGLSYLLLHRQITTPRNSFFKTTIILHWCMRFGFIQGVAICFTCEVNGFVQIRAVHSRAGPTTYR